MAEPTLGAGAISLETTDPAEGIAWQAEHCRHNGSPLTAGVIEAMLPLLAGDTAVGRRMAQWPGKVLEAAMPLRIAGGLHWLYLSGREPRLAPVYQGTLAGQGEIDAVVGAVVRDHDAVLVPWLDGPPQTNEAARSAALMAGLLWLGERVGGRFELLEIGSSAGANTMMERYRYELGGVSLGPVDSPVRIAPEWRGPPPPSAAIEIATIEGCDQAPIDLADPDAAMRLKSYIWADMTDRLVRLDAVAGLARQRPPRIARADAADWIEARLNQPQAPGTVRVLYHSIVWQYIAPAGRARISAAMHAAAAQASAERPLAWMALETNRATFRHELTLRVWRGGGAGEGERVLLGDAHAHGQWVHWH